MAPFRSSLTGGRTSSAAPLLVRRRPGRSPLSPTRAHFRGGFASGSRTAAAGRAADCCRPHAPLVLCQARCCFRLDSPTRSPPLVHLTPRVVTRVRVPLRKLRQRKAAAERISVYSRWKRTPPGSKGCVFCAFIIGVASPQGFAPYVRPLSSSHCLRTLCTCAIIQCRAVCVVDIVLLPATRTSFPAPPLRLASFDSRPFC